ncbi:hypothetical protein LOZ39_005865 [Ophidiomyces ophidiicola]|uniref:Uncharacterized protein n=1 Tax=Ophidiomyces ophidiicola TaxID=1387563 RepID=A0ACB8V1A2_9EURO|nr:hypothetical protein LOZ64_004394 [Ophidiomyces ophidiicola]KAI1914643.1 hypothetical protein LOZ61_002044 [Ophidiomyces ophidiicola]KAI1930867.1 hypothetical protein LOZ60_000527 [Ophidiomyces ophidiicola]KAI2010531.1 hypothetical protein LOZ50_001015 [Ophidiomyces ophidiicola]KAI2028994.1 hypothetical protein LOZ45_001958 [Ophidiomyces ophidiicola]
MAAPGLYKALVPIVNSGQISSDQDNSRQIQQILSSYSLRNILFFLPHFFTIRVIPFLFNLALASFPSASLAFPPKIEGIQAAVKDGANAIEIDFTAWHNGWWADHDGLPTSGSVKAEAMFVEIAKQRK